MEFVVLAASSAVIVRHALDESRAVDAISEAVLATNFHRRLGPKAYIRDVI